MSIDPLNTPSFVFVHLTTILRIACGFSYLLLVMLACRDHNIITTQRSSVWRPLPAECIAWAFPNRKGGDAG